MIAIVSYNPHWREEFDRLAAPLRAALGDLALRIDHIGSTAVPDLPAKDIIDIQITVQAFTPALEAALATLGYQRRVDITVDHRPPHVVGPDSEWEKWYFGPPADLRTMHLHVRVEGRANQRYALVFRDYLRACPAAAEAYGIIKEQLARYHPADIDAYYAVKDPVCDLIWQAAKQWAQTNNWRSQPNG